MIQVRSERVTLSDMVNVAKSLHDAALGGMEDVAPLSTKFYDEAALKLPISKPPSQKGLASDFPQLQKGRSVSPI